MKRLFARSIFIIFYGSIILLGGFIAGQGIQSYFGLPSNILVATLVGMLFFALVLSALAGIIVILEWAKENA